MARGAVGLAPHQLHAQPIYAIAPIRANGNLAPLDTERASAGCGILVPMRANAIHPYAIRALSVADTSDAARLHIVGQPDTFLTNLGKRALGIVYTALAQGESGFGVVAATPAETFTGRASGWRVIGFAAVTTSTLALYTDVARLSGMAMAREVLKSTMRRPALLKQAVESALYPLRQIGNTSAQADAELLSIMVDSAWRGAGVGSALLDALLRQLLARGVTTLEVTVDAANEGARRFYADQRFTHHSDFRLNGRAMCGYLLAYASAQTISAPTISVAHSAPQTQSTP